MTLSTHVLDLATGRPVPDLPVRVEDVSGPVALAVTDADGRAKDLVPTEQWGPGLWRLIFDVAGHLGPDAFFPEVVLAFRASDDGHLHVPLLLSPFGYSTYRGS
ncbi:5-hydroxyisourate hydrolase [Motilibacter rhizosphaerae]|uniref:5-hydroxyisourate hydrolase n=1 Tax=Motilibacter rhizosphaerae TaxID=598652 RepID=A0A4V2F559_9ACTN|nr:hydroxyisourate hydrolase [Motilibacter rhizosphaerae]RZS91679.1 5-hydroxyisourate hydrolase [Motilibacter rhizosphaerae]